MQKLLAGHGRAILLKGPVFVRDEPEWAFRMDGRSKDMGL
ncbi:Protein of unknown function [Propionibacterium freudenreichii]|nr:Protein of unknown function [Propionibacterium freudenreichii]